MTGPDGFPLESAYFDFPPQGADVSFGLKDTQPDEGYFTPPTPGQAHGDQFASLAQVQFSKQRGHRQESFVLTLTHSDANAQLQYTLDGSAPNSSNSQTYSAPITVDGTAVVRARAVRAFMSPSPVTLKMQPPLGNNGSIANAMLARNLRVSILPPAALDGVVRSGTQ